jgi:dGTPase
MDWNNLITTLRFGQEERPVKDQAHTRTAFHRDYDRLIFSTAFRRMQNKTQVFPLPGSVLVHNRLTHSLEVASIGRSLGNMVTEQRFDRATLRKNPLLHELGTIVSTACLAHDIGNPPFGHAGEKALSAFFGSEKGQNLMQQLELSELEQQDLQHFEGNANALRLLTHQFNGWQQGGFSLTYTTLAGIMKYPYDASFAEQTGKFGYFSSEKDTFLKINKTLQIPEIKPGIFARHPVVYLVEAADDISYLIMDLEDAHKLQIISTEEVKILLTDFLDNSEKLQATKRLQQVKDINQQVAYLRAFVINKLARQAVKVFMDSENEILSGTFKGALKNHFSIETREPLEQLKEIGYQKIYRHRKVTEIELAGYNILSTLAGELSMAITQPENAYSKNLKSLIPGQFLYQDSAGYEKLRGVIDFVSGMTDLYALELYRTIKGIELPTLR